ncbi:importin beta-3 subunit [Aspergillus luchuensis]|uniref:Importin beta-3 subunit n=1 Tax=Aspergillus kawachii TaxID=1069201 RepID=A0A146F2I9_ASPKA|nr:importin beta-3 subunit [Aspergillus luchuensis]
MQHIKGKPVIGWSRDGLGLGKVAIRRGKGHGGSRAVTPDARPVTRGANEESQSAGLASSSRRQLLIVSGPSQPQVLQNRRPSTPARVNSRISAAGSEQLQKKKKP